MRTKSTPVRFVGAVRDWPEDADEDKENAPRFSIQVAGKGLPAARYRVSENVRCRKVVDAYSKRVGLSEPISPGVVCPSDGTDGLAEDVCLGEVGVCAGKTGGSFVVHAAKRPAPSPIPEEEDEDEDDSSEEMDADKAAHPPEPTAPPEPVAMVQPRKTMVTRAMMRASASASASACQLLDTDPWVTSEV
jgi:hypothetical protein